MIDTDSVGVDFHSTGFLEDPYPGYALLRARDPVAHLAAFDAWIVTGFEHVRAVLQAEQYRVAFEQYQLNRMGPSVVEEEYFRVIGDTVVVNDGEPHARMRDVFRHAFTPKRVRELVGTISALAAEAVEEFAADGSVELVGRYSNHVPLCVISSLLGVPETDRAQINAWVRGFTPVLEVTPMTAAELTAANESAAGLQAYFADILRARRARPGDDFVSQALAANSASPEPLPDHVLAANFGLLYFAGQDTQSKALTNILAALSRHPDQLTALLERRVSPVEAMPELLRYDTVGQFVGRITTEPVVLAGHRIEAGRTLMVCIGAANRDPAVFDDPDRLDLTRAPSRLGRAISNISFIVGEHSCMGKHLAMTALPIMLGTLLGRLGRVEPDWDRVVRHPSLATRGYDEFPITWASA